MGTGRNTETPAERSVLAYEADAIRSLELRGLPNLQPRE